MKKFDELTANEQARAIDLEFVALLRYIVEYGAQILDEAYAMDAVNEAIEEADLMQTPWFAHEYVRDATYERDGETLKVSDLLRRIATEVAHDHLYAESGEYVVHGIVGVK
jgi:hypothetical protein